MNQKGLFNILAILCIVIVASIAGYFMVGQSEFTLAPVTPPIIIPTPISIPNQNPGSVGTGTVEPEDPNQTGLVPYPDLSFALLPAEPLSIKFVIEHRSALSGKSVKVRGVITGTLLGAAACPPNAEMCAQSSVFLADVADKNRNELYDLRVLVSESEKEANYPIGKTIEMQVVIDGNSTSVVAVKE